MDAALNRVRFSAFAFNRSNLAGYFTRIERARPEWAYGYVSMLTEFAAYCRDEGLPLSKLGIKAVVATSEVLSDGDRSTISDGFGAPVFNEYGCGEVGPVLYECPMGSLHLVAENIFVELIPDPTEDEPTAHRLVLTDLHNRATPLLRYEIEDRVVPAAPCRCGRGLPAFRAVFGRAYDFIESADGTRFHGEFFLYHLEGARERGIPIRQAQFLQLEDGRILLRIVPSAGYRRSHGDALAKRISDNSGGKLSLVTEEISQLRREASGKLRLIKGLRSTDRAKVKSGSQ